MGTLLLAHVDAPTAAVLRTEDRGSLGEVIEELPSGEDIALWPVHRLAEIDAVIIGNEATDPLRIAQHVQAADRELAIVILSQSHRKLHLERAVQFAPYLSGNVRCHSTEDTTSLRGVVRQAVAGTRKRRKHRAALAAVQTDIQSWQQQPSGSTIYLDRLLEYAPIAVVALDTEGKIQAWNRRAASMFGHGEREVLGAPLANLFPDQEQQKLGQFLADSAATQAALEPIVLQLQRADGEPLFVQCTSGPLSGRTGESGALVMLQDVTQRMAAEQALQETLDRLEERVLQRTGELARANAALEKSNIELKQFAYVASHDLQEPLRMVASFCQLLQRRYKGQLDEQADEYIDFAVSGAKRLQALIQDLLTYSRVDGKSNPFQPIDCAALVDKVILDLAASIQDAGATVQRGDLPTVMGDNSQLAQVFRNLIGNAVKYHGDTPCQVDVSAGQNGQQWVFAVRDNGIGIAPQHQKRIFDVFTRLHSSQEYPGTGIGLAICKRVVEHHGGQICLDSQPGKGSTFFFTIPVMREELG